MNDELDSVWLRFADANWSAIAEYYGLDSSAFEAYTDDDAMDYAKTYADAVGVRPVA